MQPLGEPVLTAVPGLRSMGTITAMVALTVGCGPVGKTRRQRAEEFAPTISPKVEQFRALAGKVPPEGSVEEESLPETLDPRLTYFRERKFGPSTLDFVAVGSLDDIDYEVPRACDVVPGWSRLLECFQRVLPESKYLRSHGDESARNARPLEDICAPALEANYALVVRTTGCQSAEYLDEESYRGGSITWEAFLFDLESGALLGQFAGHTGAPGSLEVLSDRTQNVAEYVQSETRQRAIERIGERLRSIGGSDVDVGRRKYPF